MSSILADHYEKKYNELQAKYDKMRDGVSFIVGWNSAASASGENPELAVMLRDLRAVLDGTWVQPGGGQ